MSLDNIQLPGFLYQSLFKNNLVEIQPEKENQPLKNKKKIDFLGSNEKKIIFLANDSQSKFLNDTQMKFLQDLLIACRLTMADIAFVNFSQNNSITYRELKDELNSEKFLIFGVAANELDLPFQIPFFQIQSFNNQQYMLAPSLKELQTNVESKKQLWICLQKIFSIRKQK
jgi:hypothetical protein